jgi:hypothetical protein
MCRLFLLIVVFFGFLNIKSVKIYAIPFICSTTLLLYKLDTLLLKQKNLPVLDITGFFFRIRTQVTALVRRPSPDYSCGKRNPLYPIRAASFVSIVLYLILNDTNTPNIQFVDRTF